MEETAFTQLNLKFCEFKLLNTRVAGVSHNVLWDHDLSDAVGCDLVQSEEGEVSQFCVIL